MLLIQQPSMQWVDPVKNSAIFQGKMYFGLPRTDPKVLANRVQVYYFDTLGNPQPLPQPVNLSDSGVPTYLNNPVEIYANETCSIRVDDRNGLEKYLVDEYPLRSSEVVGVDSIKSLPSADFATGQYSVTGFYAGSTIGGGAFVWDATRDKADHNGGTVIAPDAIVAWDGTQADLATLLNWVGSGSGCYVKTSVEFVTPKDFGYTLSGPDKLVSIDKCLNDTSGFKKSFTSVDLDLAANATDPLREEMDNQQTINQTIYGASRLINGTGSSASLVDYANFAGQSLGLSAPIGYVYHHYTDGKLAQIDNVGSGTILTLKNARNPVRRVDKPSDYVGTGNYFDFVRDDGAGASVLEAFVNKDLRFVWRFRPMVFNQGKTDTATFAFQESVDARHTFVHELRQSGLQVMYTKDTGSIFSYELGADRTVMKLSASGASQWVELGSGSGQVVIAENNAVWGVGNLALNATGRGIECRKPMILAKYPTASLPVMADLERALAFDTNTNTVKIWMGTATGWVNLV